VKLIPFSSSRPNRTTAALRIAALVFVRTLLDQNPAVRDRKRIGNTRPLRGTLYTRTDISQHPGPRNYTTKYAEKTNSPKKSTIIPTRSDEHRKTERYEGRTPVEKRTICHIGRMISPSAWSGTTHTVLRSGPDEKMHDCVPTLFLTAREGCSPPQHSALCSKEQARSPAALRFLGLEAPPERQVRLSFRVVGSIGKPILDRFPITSVHNVHREGIKFRELRGSGGPGQGDCSGHHLCAWCRKISTTRHARTVGRQ